MQKSNGPLKRKVLDFKTKGSKDMAEYGSFFEPFCNKGGKHDSSKAFILLSFVFGNVIRHQTYGGRKR